MTGRTSKTSHVIAQRPSASYCCEGELDFASVEIQQCGEVLQQTRHSGAVDQRRQVRYKN